MKFAILSLAAVAGLTLSGGTASAGPPGHYGHNHGYGSNYGYNYHPRGGHLDYHNGHYHYHNGRYVSGPLVPVYPTYSYPSYNYGYNNFGYNSGFGLTVTRPGFSFSVGNGFVQPYNNFRYTQPYYGGRRW